MTFIQKLLTLIGCGPCALCNKGHAPIWRGTKRWHSDGQEGVTTYFKCGLERD